MKPAGDTLILLPVYQYGFLSILLLYCSVTKCFLLMLYVVNQDMFSYCFLMMMQFACINFLLLITFCLSSKVELKTYNNDSIVCGKQFCCFPKDSCRSPLSRNHESHANLFI